MKKSSVCFLLFIASLTINCTKEVIKPIVTDMTHPVEPLAINILKTVDEEAREKQKEKAKEIARNLPLNIKIGQMITCYPPSFEFVKKYQIGGVILNQNFIRDLASTAELIENYNKDALIPLFFAIDQEGGKVNRLKHIKGYKKTPSAKELGMSYSKKELLAYAYRTAVTMRNMGINVNLAPSLDISSSENALMNVQERSLGSNLITVKKQSETLIEGYQAGGILCFAKHYPGYGDVRINSDVTVAHYNFPAIRMIEDLNLFLTLSHKIDGIIMSSVIYTDFDTVPALFSKSIIDLIRFSNPDILVMTDDLYAPALRILENEDLSVIATKTFSAGNDILLILWDIKAIILMEAIEKMVTAHPEMEEQVNHSVTRILLAKNRIYPGLIDTLYTSWKTKDETPPE